MAQSRRKIPEALHSDTVHKNREYYELSRSYAAKGDVYAAVHALWMADMCAVQAVMWERILIASPKPDEQFFAIATSVSRALSLHALTGTAQPDAASTIQAARDGLAQAFDEVAMRLLAARLTPLDHLVGLPAPDQAGADAVLARRLSGSSPEQLIVQRNRSAAESMNTAAGLHRRGCHADAVTHAYQSDMAIYEAYLLEAARVVGDEFLMTVDLRWELAYMQITSLPSLPSDYVEATTLIRAKLKETVSPTEADTLDERFLAVVA
ncbi:hypothetical protein [Tessaracoccus sp.]